ncbi:hypothetical protein HanXRQr2_Chr13g0572901 [Helianthus annuus]|uniref:Uncharacterized protein n=1 Tax=Helianthus annuus TaxID=4232 RepID=A0A9K3EEW3_HELAN|nr:hypothetical protein HanXRQr2_Chr13g0572901 [Helianthus annuus]KAJ0496575.1 hypothetical protein HanHA89_Chr13g0501351 [Helianthus annuus]
MYCNSLKLDMECWFSGGTLDSTRERIKSIELAFARRSSCCNQ